MNPATGTESRHPSAEQRAEELMERTTEQARRVLGRVFGRAREELEDLVADARTLKERDRNTGSDSTGSGHSGT